MPLDGYSVSVRPSGNAYRADCAELDAVAFGPTEYVAWARLQEAMMINLGVAVIRGVRMPSLHG